MNPALTFETAKIVGNPVGRCWAQTHTFSPEDKEKKEKRGNLLAVLVITGAPEGIGAVSLGREILGRLHEEYYGNLSSTAFECLGAAVKKVEQEYEGAEIVAASILGNTVYLAIVGEGKVVLKRGEEIGWLLNGEGEVQTASGFLYEGDILLLGSAHFFRVVSSGILKAALGTNLPAEAEEILAPVILGREDIADAACIIALLKKEEENFDLKTVNGLGEETTEEIIVAKKPAGKFFDRWNNQIKRLPFFRPKEIRIKSFDQGKKKKIYLAVSLFVLIGLVAFVALGLIRKKKDFKTLSPQVQTEQENKSDTEVILSNVPVFYDLKQISDLAEGRDLSVYDKKLQVFDEKNKKIYQLDLEKKSFITVDAASVSGKLLAKTGEKKYLLADEGVFEVNFKDKKLDLRISKDASWKNIADFTSFSGNLYLLDQEAKAVWRYPAKESGFGQKSSWFSGEPPDFSQIVSFSVDGAVWILQKDKIVKYVQGKQIEFSLSKMPASPQGGPESFIELSKIYTSDKEQNLYILDKGKGKIYVIAKSGEYQKAFVWEEIRQAADFVVSEGLGKIYLLLNSKIYEISLK